MEFDIYVWRKFYDKIKLLGNLLRDSTSDMHGNPSICPLSSSTRNQIETEIKDTMHKSDNYLDACGLPSSPTLWIYCRHDPKTWVSDETFIYKHLIKY